MLGKLRSRLTYANVTATLALFVAVGTGGAYAANEWTGENIVDGSLTGQDIFNNTISGADITNGSLTGQDVFDNTLAGADITNGSIGVSDIGSGGVGSDEVINDSLLQSDIRAGAVTGDEVLDGSLKDEDIAESRYVHFLADIPAIPPGHCSTGELTGITAKNDHLVLTPNLNTALAGVATYGVFYLSSSESAYLQSCNVSDDAIEPRTQRFNLLVINAQ